MMQESCSIKVNVVSRKLIKPCTPTPSHLNPYKISAIDELNPPWHVIRILYYSSHHASAGKAGNLMILQLEESLAQVLPLFYPLAGRYNKEKLQVDCNDEGAEFCVAQVNCQIDQLIDSGRLKSDQLNPLLPQEIGAVDEPTDPMLAVQINKFQCGGLAIGACASNRIFDTASVGIFLTAWANAAIKGGLDIRPEFDSPLYFPSENRPPLDFGLSRIPDKSIVTRRFLFDKNAISTLREKLAKTYASRVVVVSSVLTQALLRADKAKNDGESRASLMAQAINVRGRTVPPISKYSCGYWVSHSHLELNADEANLLANDFPGMVLKVREATIRGVEECSRLLSDKEFGRRVFVESTLEIFEKESSLGYKTVWITDWSKCEEYEVDFGFGKPVWVSMAAAAAKDLFVLMNNKNNDGIEAWINLHESEMDYFEQDEELKKYTTH